METTNPNLTPTAEAVPSTQGGWLAKPAQRVLIVLGVLALLVVLADAASAESMWGRVQTFVTIFLGIFIEAVPFLVAGSIVSGLIEVFVGREMLYRFVPRHPVLAAVAGGSLGMVFPVCECGVVPVTRRLYQKGLPLSVGIAFLLAAPVVNPIVMLSTYAAFGWGPMLWGRVILSFLIASLVGYLFHWAKASEILLPQTMEVADDHHHAHCHHDHEDTPPGSRFWQALAISGDDFLDMVRYLIVGSMLAAAMQTLVPQQILLALGGGPVTSVLAMMTLAFVLSVCSTVDAFLALAFVNTFTPASILAFLTFGPMVDIKSALMFLRVFKRRTVIYLIALPLVIMFFTAVFLNFNVRW